MNEKFSFEWDTALTKMGLTTVLLPDLFWKKVKQKKIELND